MANKKSSNVGGAGKGGGGTRKGGGGTRNPGLPAKTNDGARSGGGRWNAPPKSGGKR